MKYANPEDDPQNQCNICGGSGWLSFPSGPRENRVQCPEANPSIHGAGHRPKPKEPVAAVSG